MSASIVMAAEAVPALFGPTVILDFGLMAMLVVVGFAIVRMRSLFAIVMLQGVYSLMCAAWFVSLDAVDVAFTEAAVGAGVSTVLMLGAMLLTDRQSSPVPIRKSFGPLLIVLIAGGAMFYAIGDMPAYGSAISPANTGVGMAYMETTPKDIDIPNVVTAVLASYRSYDTMGETVVIFMAGLGILLLLGLNGNAGTWRAKVNGVNICSVSAPQARILRSEDDKPDELPEVLNPDADDIHIPAPKPKSESKPKPVAKTVTPKAKKAVKAKSASRKKTPLKKASAKKAAVKKTTTKPPAKKTPKKKPGAKS